MSKPRLRFLALFALLGVSPPAPACINDYVPNHKAIAASRSLAEELTKEELIEPWTVRRDRLRKEADAGGDYKVRNDLASALMHTGDPKAAVQILEEIERTNPGLYQTASNLGTAFELAGENEKALEWIRKGIERNPKSHKASEWIHVKILEAKVAASRDPAWETGDSILGLDFGHGSKPTEPATLPTGNSGEALSLDQIGSGLKYQLHERLQFVKAPDLIVASLLFDLGNIIALRSAQIGTAQGTYELAAKYAGSDDDANQPIRAFIGFRLRIAKILNRKHSFFADPVKATATLAIFGVIALYVLLKIRARRRRRAMARS